MCFLKFSNFELVVSDFVAGNGYLSFDVIFPSLERLESFFDFYTSHIEDADSFNFSLNETLYHGRFGDFIYDSKLNSRIYMTTIPCEPCTGSPESVFENHLPLIISEIKNQISVITNALIDKELLSIKDVESMSSYLSLDASRFELMHKVSNLNEFLSETNSTLSDIRSSQTVC